MQYLAVQQENIKLCYIFYLKIEKLLYILGKTPIKNL